jgi:hypothetical protein
MRSFHPVRPSPAMGVALLALFVSIGGVGYAALKLPKNSVGATQIRKNAVTSAKVKNRSLNAKDVKLGQFARPADLGKYLPLHGTAADSFAFSGMPLDSFELGGGNILSGAFTGKSTTTTLVPLPNRASLDLKCNASGFATAFQRIGGDTNAYDIFTTTFKNGVAPSLSYVRLGPGQVLYGIDPTDRQTVYDISADDGTYAHVIVSGHFDSASKQCTVKGRGFSSRAHIP